MAIGLGRILGFRLLENFNHPYLATSFTDFWRRWHISLSTWIKEYLYIPLGGNRVSRARSYANLCICFVLSGLWHGASWNFVLWGCVHGVALMADRAFWLKWQQALPAGVNRALTFLLVMLAWVFFRCPKLPHASRFFHALAGATKAAGGQGAPIPTDATFVLCLGISVVLAPLITRRIEADRIAGPALCRIASLAGCGVLLFFSVARMTVSSFHPFLYFRF
jgi:alginate O-acetyltransferase complex protein AlgI